ncbi:glycosyltransferase family 2 protein [Jannaschia formosa]|uniref:glycosyltransferase family 2 protein n=1 Tax=Jannaschia formosa TaxID=2259592 RepID=UPI000E1C3D58|nr:glycosyltransferase family 2 protein [Jannaschia formosa]TFL18095.1 glycosyltransferase family 2 protein [Jannaschia formosa]
MPDSSAEEIVAVARGGLKLIVQIPCYNEAETLPQVLAGIPRSIPGIGQLDIQVIDDGSSDGTADVARAHGVAHVVVNSGNKGLARSFQAGIDNALRNGADIVVNTDGDNQYCGASIPDLVAPILRGEADIVVGDRKPGLNREFSPLKRFLQRFGSSVVRRLSGVEVADAVSGFRAYSREAALTINVMTTFSYTTETLIHAGQHGLKVVSVPVEVNPVARPSRLFRSMGAFLRKQIVTILRSYMMYRPLNAFLAVGLVMMVIGAIPILRFLVYFAMGDGTGRVQSLVLGGVFLLAGYLTVVIAFLSDTIATNRRLIERVLTRVRELELASRTRDRPEE